MLVPESGDSIQTLKAGLMEIADIFVVNKADRPGADRLRNELELMLGLRDGSTLKNVPAHHGVDLSRADDDRRAARDESGACRARGREGRSTPERVDAAGAAHRCGEGRGNRPRSSPRSTGTSVILKRAGRSASAGARGYANASSTSLKSGCERRLWNDAATNEWLDDQLGALEAGTTNPFDVADAAAGSEWRPSDADRLRTDA